MATKKYTWRGFTYKIADEDLSRYPGAVLVDEKPKKEYKKPEDPIEEPKVETKAKSEPKNKARNTAKNKSKSKKKE